MYRWHISQRRYPRHKKRGEPLAELRTSGELALWQEVPDVVRPTASTTEEENRKRTAAVPSRNGRQSPSSTTRTGSKAEVVT